MRRRSCCCRSIWRTLPRLCVRSVRSGWREAIEALRDNGAFKTWDSHQRGVGLPYAEKLRAPNRAFLAPYDRETAADFLESLAPKETPS